MLCPERGAGRSSERPGGGSSDHAVSLAGDGRSCRRGGGGPGSARPPSRPRRPGWERRRAGAPPGRAALGTAGRWVLTGSQCFRASFSSAPYRPPLSPSALLRHPPVGGRGRPRRVSRAPPGRLPDPGTTEEGRCSFGRRRPSSRRP